MSRETDIAWAAGVFEGEGTTAFAKATHSIHLVVSMTDRDVIERLHSIMGVGNLGVRDKAPHKRQWQWRVQSIDDVRFVAAAFLPYLGDRRRARLVEVLDAYNTAPVRRQKRGRCVNGHEYNEQNTAYYNDKKKCRECNRLRAERHREKVKAYG